MSAPRLAWARLYMAGGAFIEVNPSHVSAVRPTAEGTFVFLLGRDEPFIVEHDVEDVQIELQDAVNVARDEP